MKKTILSDIHKSLGAKMVEYAGFYMPVQYEGVTIEHNLVRNHVGIFDVSHMGEIFITGKDSLKFFTPFLPPTPSMYIVCLSI